MLRLAYNPADAAPPPDPYAFCIGALARAFKTGKLTAAVVRDTLEGFPDVEDKLLLAGALALLRADAKREVRPMDPKARERLAASGRRTKADKEYCRLHRIHFSEAPAHKMKLAVAMIQENAAKAAKYEKVVEMLDTWMVGDTRLGECTKEKLLAEAARYNRTAADLAAHSAVYTRLASHLRPNETIRTSTKREAVLDILLALKPDAVEPA